MPGHIGHVGGIMDEECVARQDRLVGACAQALVLIGAGQTRGDMQGSLDNSWSPCHPECLNTVGILDMASQGGREL